MNFFFFLAKSMGLWKNITKIRIEKKTYNIAKFLHMVQEGIQKYIRMLELFHFMFLLVTKFGLNTAFG